MIPEEVRFYFWIGRQAKSIARGQGYCNGRNLYPLNILSHGEIKIKR